MNEEKKINYNFLLIHSAKPIVTIGSDIILAQISVRPYTFQNIVKQNKRLVKIMITTGGTLGLAEGIIDDNFLSFYAFLLLVWLINQISLVMR